MSQFRCIHCGSRRTPDSYIDDGDDHNKQLFNLLLVVTLLTCCLGVPVFFLYPVFARRKHRCKDCGITL